MHPADFLCIPRPYAGLQQLLDLLAKDTAFSKSLSEAAAYTVHDNDLTGGPAEHRSLKPVFIPVQIGLQLGHHLKLLDVLLLAGQNAINNQDFGL